jgi:hypothetical protein
MKRAVASRSRRATPFDDHEDYKPRTSNSAYEECPGCDGCGGEGNRRCGQESRPGARAMSVITCGRGGRK